MKTLKNPRIYRGFTLLELMTALIVVSILATAAMPELSSFVRSAHLTEATNDFVTVLNTAKGEAVKRGQRVTVCHSANGSTCGAGGTWGDGWLIFVDANASGTYEAGDTLLLTRESVDEGYSLTSDIALKDYISFDSTGLARMSGGALQQGTISLRHDSTGNGRDIVLSGGSLYVNRVQS